MVARVYSFCLDLLIRGLWDFSKGPFKLSVMKDGYEFSEEHRYWSDVSEMEVSGGNCPAGGWVVEFDSLVRASDGSVILPLKSFKMRRVAFESRKFILHGYTKEPYMVNVLMFYYELDTPLVKQDQNVYVTWDMRGSLLVFYG